MPTDPNPADEPVNPDELPDPDQPVNPADEPVNPDERQGQTNT